MMKSRLLLFSLILVFTGCLSSSDSGPDNAADLEFLEQFAQQEGVIETENGLLYKILEEGDGEIPAANSTVLVDYHGTLVSGNVFDSSVDRGEPAIFNLGGVISGFSEGIQLMPVGSKYKLVLPPQLAYGNNPPAFSNIHVGAVLIFDTELLEILEE